MATYVFTGYGDYDFAPVPGSSITVGGSVAIPPDWDSATSAHTFTFTDDDATLSGDAAAPGIGDDAGQTVTVTDAGGTVVGTGQVYVEERYTLIAPDGHEIHAWTVKIGDTYMGAVAAEQIQPGVHYQISDIRAADGADSALYTNLVSQVWDPAVANDLRGGDGNETLIGGGGDDTIYFGHGSNALYGGDGADFIDDAPGTSYLGDDLIYGGAGTDTLSGGDGRDSIYGDADADTIYAEAGDDIVEGGTGDDLIYGAAGADTLSGGAGADRLFGGTEADTLDGGTGDDTLTGGAGDDLFRLTPGGGADQITDFDMTPTGGGTTADRFDAAALQDAGGNPLRSWDVTVTDQDGSALLQFPDGSTVLLSGVAPAEVAAPGQLQAMGIPCFAAGTPIATPGGDRRVEDLRPGDLVRTAGGAALPVLWCGARQLAAAELAAEPRLRPVAIRAGILGNRAELRLSRQHGVAVACRDGPRLIPARYLLDLDLPGVREARGCKRIGYHHLLLPRHALVDAGGAWVESLWPGPVACAALGPAARAGLIAALPRLAPAILGSRPVEEVYGPRALPRLARRDLPRAGLRRMALRPDLPTGAGATASAPGATRAPSRAPGMDRPMAQTAGPATAEGPPPA